MPVLSFGKNDWSGNHAAAAISLYKRRYQVLWLYRPGKGTSGEMVFVRLGRDKPGQASTLFTRPVLRCRSLDTAAKNSRVNLMVKF